MIEKVLETLRSGIQDFLVRQSQFNLTNQPVVHASSVVGWDGRYAIPDNGLGITLVNIEEERVLKPQNSTVVSRDGRVAHVNPEIRLNLYVLVAANFQNYPTGLEFLTGAMRFFQVKSVFTRENTPTLNPAIEKLIVELFTMGFEQQNHLWGALGAKYLPSVVYRVRLLAIQEGQMKDEGAPITTIDFAGKGMGKP